MIVDWHAHVYPPELAKERRWGGASPLTIENLLEAHERAGINLCVVSNTIHYLKDKNAKESLAFLDAFAPLVEGHQRDEILIFPTMSSLPTTIDATAGLKVLLVDAGGVLYRI